MNIILRKILGRSKELDDLIMRLEIDRENKNPPTRLQKIRRKITKGIKTVIKLHLAAYLLSTAAVAGDYFFYRKHHIMQKSQTENQMDVRRYSLNINGQKKHLTLVGETHNYSQLENKIALELVKENTIFASECGKGFNELTPGNGLYLLLLSVPIALYVPFYKLGTGRWYDCVSDEAFAAGKKVYALENQNAPFDNLSAGQKAGFFAGFLCAGLTGPYYYYSAINKEELSDEEILSSIPYKKEIIDERDPEMAKRVIMLLEKNDVQGLVANVGRLHIKSILKYLKEHKYLEETENQ